MTGGFGAPPDQRGGLFVADHLPEIGRHAEEAFGDAKVRRIAGLDVVEHVFGVVIEHGADLVIEIGLRSRDGRVPSLAIGLVRADGTPVYGVSSDMDGHVVRETGPGEYRGTVEFPALPLLPGSYAIRVHSMDPEGVRLFDTVERGLVVRGASREFGLVRLAHRWIGDAAAMPAADADA